MRKTMEVTDRTRQRNIKLLIEYDGTDFIGWQVQLRGRSVQGEIETALKRLLQEEVNVIGAGRTDAGVHARGQVANFRTTTRWSVEELHRALSAILPEDIVLRSAEEVPLEFHSRYSAVERCYRYFITREKRALSRQYSWLVPYPLDLPRMNEAAALCEGEHDFEAFSKTDSGASTYTCTVRKAFWIEEGAVRIFEIRADHFVRGMVRSLVGSMIDVGRGFRTVDQFHEIMTKRDRKRAGMAAPAKGVVLEEVLY
jgi:tRNA pseudouridine38-40 synthase